MSELVDPRNLLWVMPAKGTHVATHALFLPLAFSRRQCQGFYGKRRASEGGMFAVSREEFGHET